MGNENPQSLARLQEETQRGNFDAVLHVGKITMCFQIKDYFVNG